MDEKVFTVKAEINVKLTQQDIDDIMVAALEGGINYSATTWVNMPVSRSAEAGC